MKRIIAILIALSVLIGLMAGAVGCKKVNDESTATIRNLYFSDWNGDDPYTAFLEEKFGIKITPSTYSWADWTQNVRSAANSNNLSDVFQVNVDSYNFANSYAFWADDRDIKPLPSDLSRWPNLKAMIDGISDISYLKYKAKGDKEARLWGIPIAKNVNGGEADFAPFTYVYRRDWAKDFGVYKEGDVYTWEEFQALLTAFHNNLKRISAKKSALVDVEWGFPSVINFYKTAPHCFAVSPSGKIVSNYATEEYLTGLELAKTYVSGGVYGYDQFNSNDGDAIKEYYSERAGIFYENLSLSNYTTLRKKFKDNNRGLTQAQLDDRTAILKVKGPDGKFALEGQLDWFSMTFFSADISDEKMHKILNIMDYLLSEAGTMMAKYGFEGYDYYIENGEVVLSENGWEKEEATGQYIEKYNGAKFLRYTCTLGYDMIADDPMTDKAAYAILNEWKRFMTNEQAAGNLRVLNEDPAVKWLNDKSVAKNKTEQSGNLLDGANEMVMKYVNGTVSFSAYKNSVTDKTWQKVLEEINNALGR